MEGVVWTTSVGLVIYNLVKEDEFIYPMTIMQDKLVILLKL
jgi:disulfide oxidoreductase YuzD